MVVCLSGCESILDMIFGAKTPTPNPHPEPAPQQKVEIKVTSKLTPRLEVGDTYQLTYECNESVKVECSGRFNPITEVFTATKPGEFTITLTAGEGDARNSVTVNITVGLDRTELKQAITRAEEYNSSDYVSFANVTRTLETAREALVAKSLTQEDIDTATKALTDACEALKPLPLDEVRALCDNVKIVYDKTSYFADYYVNFNDVSTQIKALNADTSIKLVSGYTSQAANILAKLTTITTSQQADMNKTRGVNMAQKIINDYYRTDIGALVTGKMFYNAIDANGNAMYGGEATDFWTMGSLLAMAVSLDKASGGQHQAEVDKVIAAMSYYRGVRNDNTAGEGGAAREFSVYGVHRSNKPNSHDVYGDHGEESVFDDQIWAAIEFVNAYELHKDKKYLDYAIELTDYIYLVGNDPYLNGIYWGQAYTSRHACSNAPFVGLAVKMYQATDNVKYLNWAKTIYKFAYDNLRDSDNLYCDLIRTVYKDDIDVWHGGKAIANGGLDKTKYSYNSGAMVTAGVALYNVTGEQHYLDEAKATAYAARQYFGRTDVKQGYRVYPGSDGNTTYSWFNLILFKGYLDLYLADNSTSELLDEVQAVVNYDYSMYQNNGYMPTTGLVGWTGGRNSYEQRVLMDHVTNADMLMLLAEYNEAKEKQS